MKYYEYVQKTVNGKTETNVYTIELGLEWAKGDAYEKFGSAMKNEKITMCRIEITDENGNNIFATPLYFKRDAVATTTE